MRNYIIIHFIICMLPVIGIFYFWFFGPGGSGKGLTLIVLGLMSGFILSILTGIIGTKLTQNIWIPTAINCCIIAIAMILAREWEVGLFIIPVFILTFLSSFFTKLLTNPFSNSFLQKGGLFLLGLLVLAFVFTFFSYLFDTNSGNGKNFFFDTKNTKMAYKMEYPGQYQIDQYREYAKATGINENDIRHGSTLFKNKYNSPYSGRFYLYNPKLRISPFPKKRHTLYYYIDGFLWGFSHSGSYTEYYTKNALIYLPGMPASVPFLISDNYEKQVLESLSVAGEYYRLSDDTLLALGDDNHLYVGRFAYHPNKIMQYISWDKLDFTDYGWEHFDSRYFDSLGYCAEESAWNPNAFILTDTVPDLLSTGIMKDPEKIKLMEEAFINPVKIWLPDTDYKWNYEETLLHNVCRMHDFDEKDPISVEIMIAGRKDTHYHLMEIPDMQIIADAIDQCIIETYYERGVESGDIYFLILENGSDKKFSLTYEKGRFYMENNFYRFIFPEDKREELTNRMLTCIRKYKENAEV